MRSPFLRRLREQLEAALMAAAFAEERETETAREILGRPGGPDAPRPRR